MATLPLSIEASAICICIRKANRKHLFTDNETNTKRLYNFDNGKQFYKDGVNDYIIYGNSGAVNPEKRN